MKFQTLFAGLCPFCLAHAYAQEMDPRAYANLPKDMNVLVAAYALARGHVLADPSLPIKDFKITSHNFAIGYVHTFGLVNKLARVNVVLPFVSMAGQLQFRGQDTSGSRTGFGDARVQFAINLIGSPALTAKDFRSYTQKTVVGIGLVTSIPTGLYYADKTINIGTNRWAFKPEIGISRRFKHLYADGYIGIWLYTNNTKYQSSKLLQQEPVVSAQLHASYYFKNKMWVGINSTWFDGGQTTINNTNYGDRLDHWRIGASWGVPVAKQQAVKLQFHFSAHTNYGQNYKLIALSYQYAFF